MNELSHSGISTTPADPGRDIPALAVMARRPALGKVKRRLADDIGAEAALQAYRRLLLGTLAAASGVTGVRPYLALEPRNGARADPEARLDHNDSAWPRLGRDWTTLDQRGDDLGQRLASVAAQLFGRGHSSVALIGADCPEIPGEFLARAFSLVEDREDRPEGGPGVVFGPAFDGGYYLVAFGRRTWDAKRTAIEEMLAKIPMGDGYVLRRSLEVVQAAGIRAHLLPAWPDVDTLGDLRLMNRVAEGRGGRGESLTGLREIYLHVTNACNGSCAHCYLRTDVTSRIESAPAQVGGVSLSCGPAREMTTGEWLEVIGEALALGARSFVFIGGDPLQRPDLLELIGAVTGSHEARARVFLNGPLAEADVEALAEQGHGCLTPLVSLDGTAGVNDALRGSGNYESTLRAAALLLRAGLSPVVNSVLLRPVLPTLPDLARHLAHAGLDRLHLILPHQRGPLAAASDLVPTGEELYEAFSALETVATHVGVLVDNITAWQTRFQHPRDFCSAGCTLLAVDAGGGVYACPITCGDPAFIAGRLVHRGQAGPERAATTSLETIWRESPALDLLRHSHARERLECAACDVVDACGGECWVQGHYAAVAKGARAGYQAPFPYCGFLQPILRRMVPEAPLQPELTPFDCI
jgi:uncharacterized protein